MLHDLACDQFRFTSPILLQMGVFLCSSADDISYTTKKIHFPTYRPKMDFSDILSVIIDACRSTVHVSMNMSVPCLYYAVTALSDQPEYSFSPFTVLNPRTL